MCVLIFSTFVWSISHSVQKWARCDIIIYLSASCTVAVTVVRFSWNLNFLTDFRKHPLISDFIKIRLNRVVPRVRMDMTKLILALRNFANAPNIELCLSVRPSVRLRNHKLWNFIFEGGRKNSISFPIALIQRIFWSNTKAQFVSCLKNTSSYKKSLRYVILVC